MTQHCQVTSVESQLTTASDTVSANFLLPSPVIKPAPEECNGHNGFLKAQGLRGLVPMVTYTDNLASGQRNIPSAETTAAPEGCALLTEAFSVVKKQGQVFLGYSLRKAGSNNTQS